MFVFVGTEEKAKHKKKKELKEKVHGGRRQGREFGRLRGEEGVRERCGLVSSSALL